MTAENRRAVDSVLSAALLRAEPDPARAEAITRIAGSGKALRPALSLAVGAACGVGAPSVPAAAAVELMHWATLVHDDVIDGATMRHGSPTLNSDGSIGEAIVAGDLLIGAVFDLAASCGTEVVSRLARTLTTLCAGQNTETALRWRTDATESQVLDVYAAKAGSLLGCAAYVGAVGAGADLGTAEAAAQFGVAFGVSLQIMDDLLDVTSSAERMGKPVGADLAGGVVTLPTVAALRRVPELRELFRPDLDARQRRRAQRLLRTEAALRHTLDEARRWAGTAADALRGATGSPTALAALAAWPAEYLEAMVAGRMDPAIGRRLHLIDTPVAV